MIVYRYRHHLLGVVLTDYILVEMFLDFDGPYKFQRGLQGLALAQVHLFGEYFTGLCNAAVADMRTVARNEHQCVLLPYPAERASNFLCVFCHGYFPFLEVSTSSTMPCSLASSAFIQ